MVLIQYFVKSGSKTVAKYSMLIHQLPEAETCETVYGSVSAVIEKAINEETK